MKEHTDNDDERHDNCNNDKCAVNEDNNDIGVHNFIVCNDTRSLLVVALLAFMILCSSLFITST